MTRKYALLAPLMVPTGWIIHHNGLFNEEPTLEDGTPNPLFNDSEDLIWAERSDYILQYIFRNPKEENTIPDINKARAQNIYFDLGWYEFKQEPGFYRAQLFKGDQLIAQFITDKTATIISMTNHCLSDFLMLCDRFTRNKQTFEVDTRTFKN